MRLGSSSLLVLGVTLAVFFAGTPPAGAFNTTLRDWQDTYGPGTDWNSSSGDTAQCQLCHRDTDGGDPWNGHGWDLREARLLPESDLDRTSTPSSNQASFRCVQLWDSDSATGDRARS